MSAVVTDENLRYWMRLVLECWDEQAEKLGFGEFADVWMAVVQTEDGVRVGYRGEGAL